MPSLIYLSAGLVHLHAYVERAYKPGVWKQVVVLHYILSESKNPSTSFCIVQVIKEDYSPFIRNYKSRAKERCQFCL